MKGKLDTVASGEGFYSLIASQALAVICKSYPIQKTGFPNL
jgi:hypothetical protein